MNERAAFLDMEMLFERGGGLPAILQYVQSTAGKRITSKLKEYEIRDKLSMKVSRMRKPVFLAIRGGGRKHVEEVAKLLGELRPILESAKYNLVIVCTADHSLMEHYRRSETSLPASYARQFYDVLSLGDAENVVRSLMKCDGKAIKKKKIEDIACEILSITGGHPGLISVLMQDLRNRGWNTQGNYWNERCRRFLMASNVMRSIRMTVEEDSRVLTREALRYEHAGAPRKLNEAMLVLRESGVLVRGPSGGLQLCPGVIKETIAKLSRQSESSIASLSPAMKAIVVEHAKTKVDDRECISVLHLSDIHIGPNYRFRMTWGGRDKNETEPYLEEMIKDDIMALGLTDKISLVTVTGDVLEGSNESELSRARDFLTNLCKGLGVPTDRLVIVPGNHDVRWDPDEFSSVATGASTASVSLERFELLYETVKKSKWQTFELVCIPKDCAPGRMIVLGFNSNYVAMPHRESVGYIAPDDFILADKKMQDFNPKINEDDSVWMVLHHHVFPATITKIDKARRGEVSVLGNASELLRWGRKWKAKVILHGHEHQPLVTVSRQWPQDDGLLTPEIAVIGAGSAGVIPAELGPFGRNQYNIIQADSNGIMIASRRLGETARSFTGNALVKIGWAKYRKRKKGRAALV